MKIDIRLPLIERRCHSIHDTACDHGRLWKITSLVISSLRRFMMLVLVGVALGYSGMGYAESFSPDKQEILLMPQLCQWMYGARAGLDPALIPRSHTMDTSGCTRYHYYCDAHVDLVRAEKSFYTNKGRAKEKLDSAIRTLKGQVQFHNTEPSCSKYLRADISYTLGKALERLSRLTKSSVYYVEAIGSLLQTIELTPEDIRPYQLLGNIYIALNKPQQAEEAIYNGLQINPKSKPLLRRYKEIGGKRSLPSEQPAMPVEAGRAHQDADVEPVKEQDAPPATVSNIPKSSQGNPNADGSVQRAETQTNPDNVKAPRYCRFCVDTNSD